MSTRPLETPILDNTTADESATTHQLIAVIHQRYAPALDLITCEVLDSVLQSTTTEHIALFSQLNIDTVRRAQQIIEMLFCTTSHTQIIVNCTIRHWHTTSTHQNEPQHH